MSILYVRPTGDTSGAKDHANIQAALDDADVATVVLSGQYYINDTLTITNKLLTGVAPHISRSYPTVTHRGDTLKFTGSADATKYAVMCHGGAVHSLKIWADRRSRGLCMVKSTYMDNMLRDVVLQTTLNVALDLVDCWGSSMEGVKFSGTYGIALRMYRCNGFRATGLQFTTNRAFHNTSIAQDTATWEYACDNGQAAAKTNVVGYAESWPAVDDESTPDGYGGYVVTPEAERAVVVIGGAAETTDVVRFLGIVAEHVHCGEYPFIYNGACHLRMSDIYMESGHFAVSPHVSQWMHTHSVSDNYRRSTHVSIENMEVLALQRKMQYLIRATGYSRYLSANNINVTTNVTDAVIACDGGNHVAPSVTRLGKGALSVCAAITTLNGAAIVGDDIHEYGSHSLASDQSYHLGDSATDGSWRMTRSGDNLVMQRRESGNWVTKSTIAAT